MYTYTPPPLNPALFFRIIKQRRRLKEKKLTYIYIHNAAGAGAYFFAKRSVNADRKARHEEDEKRRRRVQALEHGAMFATTQQQQEAPRKNEQRRTTADNKQKDVGNKGISGSLAPPPEPDGGGQTTTTGMDKSKYEAREPFRAKKGDRFS